MLLFVNTCCFIYAKCMFPKMVGFRGLLAGSIMLRRIHLQHQIDSETFKIMKIDPNRVEIEDLGLKLGPNEFPGCSESNGSLFPTP